MLNFDYKKTVRYWIDGAKYDIDVAQVLYEKEKYPYALFMGHLAIEKLLKAIIVKETKKHAPYSHSLLLLAETTKIKIPKKMNKQLARFTEFHIEARYPTQQNDFYKECTKEFTAKNLSEIKEVFSWLKKKS